MNKTRQAIVVSLLAFVLTVFGGCGKSTTPGQIPEEAPSPNLVGQVTRAVFLFNSEACPCERTRNEEAEGIMMNVLSGQTDVRPLEKIDVAKSPAELERYQRLTKFTVMPVLLGLDGQGQVANRIEGFFKEPEVESILISMP